MSVYSDNVRSNQNTTFPTLTMLFAYFPKRISGINKRGAIDNNFTDN
jgi:hypothetical protein